MNLIRLADPAAVAIEAADVVTRVVTARPDARILLPAGATPVPLYAELRRRSDGEGLDLAGTHLFQLDELVGVPATDDRSFQGFLRTHVLDRVARSPGCDHVLDGVAASPRDEIARHGAALDALGGADLVLLGLGPNGHVAYNEPGSTAADGARVVELQRTTSNGLERAFGPEHTPRLGLTLGLREILAGREIVLLVTGAAKADALRRFLDGPADSSFPASLLRAHPALTILTDID